MRILIEGTPNYLNMGDLAMLQVCLRRLRKLWPDARIWAMTSDPARLKLTCPGVEPVFAEARELWLRPGRARGEWHAPPSARQFILDLIRLHQPAVYARLVSVLLPKQSATRPLVRAFFETVRSMDLYVVAGMGAYTSAFEPDVLSMFRSIPLMKSFGMQCVAFGQGIGPIDRGSASWREARRAFPALDFLTLREARSGPACLSELGIASDRYVVTGDDGIELAYELRAASEQRRSIGCSLRSCAYSGVTGEDERRVATVLRELAQRLDADLRSTPVSHIGTESDAAAFARMFPQIPSPDYGLTPEWLIREIGRCRIVVTGSYHAAVFALAQGIPAVCVVNSHYYRDKFLGLAAQFGLGCHVVDLSEPGFDRALLDAAGSLWREAEGLCSPLQASAGQQVEASQRAWATLSWRVRARRNRRGTPEG